MMAIHSAAAAQRLAAYRLRLPSRSGRISTGHQPVSLLPLPLVESDCHNGAAVLSKDRIQLDPDPDPHTLVLQGRSLDAASPAGPLAGGRGEDFEGEGGETGCRSNGHQGGEAGCTVVSRGLCKFFINSGPGSCLRGELCPFEHCSPDSLKRERKEWLEERWVRREEQGGAAVGLPIGLLGPP